MKKVIAGLLALTMTVSSVPFAQLGDFSGVLTASALTIDTATVISNNVTYDCLVLNSDLTVTNGATVTVNGDMIVDGGKLDIQNGKVIVMGNFAQNSQYTGGSTDVSGGTLDVRGDLWIGDKEFNVGDGNVIVGNNLYLAGGHSTGTPIMGYGKLVMSGSGTVDVQNNMVIKLPSVARYGKQLILTSGTLSVGGDLTSTVSGSQSAGTTYYNSITSVSDEHKTVLDGNSAQKVSLSGLKLGTVELQQNGSNYTGDDTSTIGQVVNYNAGGGDVSKATVTLSQNTAAYTGSEIKPAATVKIGSKVLTQGTDYTVSYSNNIAPGTATCTITGINNYEGTTATVNFTINAANISGAIVSLSQTTYTYSGSECKPAPTVTLAGRTLKNGTDYTVSYSKNVDKGNAVCTITGKGGYTGTKSANFTIGAQSISTADVTVSPSSYTYSGSAFSPDVTVKMGTKTLTKGTDYSVTYNNNIKAGTPTVTIIGLGNYNGSKTATFKIDPLSLSKATVTLSPTSFTYSGTTCTPTPTVKVGSKTLTKNTDYKVTYDNNNKAGTASYTITGIGNYSGEIKGTFTIAPQDVSSATVTLSQTTYTYSGSECKPTPTVKVGGKTLTNGTDYKVSYSNNNKAGTATCTITGMGNYTGTKSVNFTIKAPASSSSTASKTNISGATVTLSQTTYTYSGSECKPTPTVKVGGKTLTNGTDYKVSYSNNNKAGTAICTITGIGNYTGTKSVNFTIKAPASSSTASKTNISGATVTLSQTTYTYSGSECKPTPTVKVGGKTLTNGTDYKVSYSNNNKAGTATCTITGIGNYTGTKSVNFTIKAPASSSTASKTNISGATVTLSQTTYTYSGSECKPTPTVKVGGKTLTNGTDYKVSYSNNNKAGTATCTITGTGNYTGTKSVNFTIKAPASSSTASKTNISGATVTLSQTTYTYSGSECKPTPTVKVGGKTLTNGTDYKVSYSNNNKAGTATCTITGMGNYTGTKSVNFTIKAPASSSSTASKTNISGATVTLSQTTYTYSGSECKPTPTVKVGGKTLTNGTDYKVSYSNNNKAGTATCTITGMGNYTGTKSVNFTIKAPASSSTASKTNISGATVTLSQTTYTYSGSECKPTPTVKVGGKTLTSGTDYKVSYSNNNKAGTATCTITGTGNYTGTKSVNFTIKAPAASSSKAPAASSKAPAASSSKAPTASSKAPAASSSKAPTTSSKAPAASSSKAPTTSSKAPAASSSKAPTTSSKAPAASSSKAPTTSSKAPTTSSTASKTDISGASVSVGGPYAYTSAAMSPEPTVKLGGKTLKKGTDYKVSYTNNRVPGTATCTITGTGDYTGKATGKFTIAKRDLSTVTLTLSQTEFTYTGGACRPAVTVNVGGIDLPASGNYTVSYKDNIQAGTAVCTITGSTNCTGSQSKTFTINKADLSSANVSLATSTYKFNGNAVEPVPRVTLNGRVLTFGKDFTVSYRNNDRVGEASYTVEGINSYTGRVSGKFTLTKAQTITTKTSISGASAEFAEGSLTYTGEELTPSPVVKMGDVVLTKGVDYTVSYSSNTAPGTAYCTITGTGSYTGTKKVSFKIEKIDVNTCTAVLEKTMYTYNGTAQTPAVTVTNGGQIMSEGTDYKVQYTDNVQVGKASVVITGMGCFTGTKTVAFDIGKISLNNCSVTLPQTSYTYDGREKKPVPLVKLDGEKLTKDVDYTVSYTNNTQVGTANVIIKGIGNCEGEKSMAFSIVKRGATVTSISRCTISIEPVVYFDGTEKTPKVTVTHGDIQLEEGVDFTVNYVNNVDEGVAFALISGLGAYTGSADRTFIIEPDDGTHNVDDSSEDEGNSSSDNSTTDSRPDNSSQSGSDDSSKGGGKDKISRGDVNADGNINVTDIALVAAHIKGIKALDADAVKRADVNNDDSVNVTDIAMMASHIKGIKPLA